MRGILNQIQNHMKVQNQKTNTPADLKCAAVGLSEGATAGFP